MVNSFHHQGVADPGGLTPPAGAPTTTLLEAAEDPTRTFALGVQWHPEDTDGLPASSRRWSRRPPTRQRTAPAATGCVAAHPCHCGTGWHRASPVRASGHGEGLRGDRRPAPGVHAGQPIFFVATAPSGSDGHVNVSPKGMRGSFAVLGEHRVAYLDYTGSGAETIAHLRDNGRITLMFCAFDGPPKIVRLHGRGRAVLPGRATSFADLLRRASPVPDDARPALGRSWSTSTGSATRAATRCRSWTTSGTVTCCAVGRAQDRRGPGRLPGDAERAQHRRPARLTWRADALRARGYRPVRRGSHDVRAPDGQLSPWREVPAAHRPSRVRRQAGAASRSDRTVQTPEIIDRMRVAGRLAAQAAVARRRALQARGHHRRDRPGGARVPLRPRRLPVDAGLQGLPEVLLHQPQRGHLPRHPGLAP